MANISSVNLPDGSSYNFKDSVSGYITSPNVVYCTCSTAAATAAKVATVVAGTFTSADLVAGAQVLVKFTYANTVASPTLNVNSTGAIYIKRYGTTAPSTSAATSWNAGSVVLLTYDGSYWQQVGFLNSTYSEISVANITNGSGTTTGLITGRRAKSAVEAFAPVTSVNGSTGAVTVSVPTKTSDLTNDSGFITDAGVTSFNGSTGAVTYTAPVTSVNGNTGDVTISVPTLLEGSTSIITPSQVLTALQNGDPIHISYTHPTYGIIEAYSFNYSDAVMELVSNIIAFYGGTYMLFELHGNTYTNTWSVEITQLAQSSDIPTVPTNVSAFTNDAGYLTQHQDISGKADQTSIDILVDAIVNGIADGTIIESTMIRAYGDGVLIGESGSPVCAYVNANGSFDVVSVTWDGNSILSTTVLASYGVDGTVQQIKFESAIDSNGDPVAMQPDLDALEQRVATIENTEDIYGYKADEIETTRVKFVNEDTTVLVWSKEVNGHLVLKKQ